MKKRFRADIQELENVFAFFSEELSGYLDEMTENAMKVVIEELFVNIAHYAYERIPADEMNYEYPYADLDIEVDKDAGRFTMTLEDEGYPFNPLDKPDPDMEEYIRERRIGGLGIVLVKKLCDAVEYERKDGKNRLTIYKKF